MLSRTATITVLIVLFVGGAALRWWPHRPAPIERALAEFITASGNQRLSVARFSEPFPWRPAPASRRGSAVELSLGALEAAVDLERTARALPRTQESLRARGILELALRGASAAVPVFEDAVEVSPNVTAHNDLAAVLLEQGRATGSAQDAARALNEAETALGLSPELPAARFNKAIALEQLKTGPVAARAWRAYLEVESDGPWATEARTRLSALDAEGHVGTDANLVGASDAVLDGMARTDPARLERRINDELLGPWSKTGESNLAVSALRAGRVMKALGYATPLLELAEIASASGRWDHTRRDCIQRGVGLTSEARRDFADGNARRSAEAVVGARAAFRCAGVNPVAAILPLAWAAVLRGDSKAGAKLAHEALGLAGTHAYRSVEAQANEVLSAVALDESRFSDSEDLRKRALESAQRARDTDTVSRLHLLLGEIAQEEGDHARAWLYFRDSLGALRPDASAYQRYDVLSTVTIALAHAGWMAAADALSVDLLEVARRVNQPGPQIMALMQRSRARAALGDAGGAAADLKHATQIVADLPAGGSRAAWQAEVGWIEGLVLARVNAQAAIQGLSTAIEYFNHEDRRFRLAELLLHRGRLYRDLHQDALARADWNNGSAVLEDQRPAIRDEQLRISRAAEVWGLFSESIQSLEGEPRAALAVLERAKARELLDDLSRSQQRPARDVASLQACLPEGVSALVFYVLPDHLLRWTVSRDRVQLDSSRVTDREIKRLVASQLGALQHDVEDPSSGQLSQLLIPASLKLDRAAHLVLVPDGALARVAFAALPLADGRRLVEASIPIVSPSLTTFCSLTPGPRPMSASALLVGIDQADSSTGLSPLPNVTAEIDSLAKIYGRRSILRGPEATAQAILREIPKHTIVHFAGHAMVDELQPSKSRLFTAASEIRPSDISALRLYPGTTVVLAACQTSIGRVYSGEGALSLARPFLASGAAGVLGSLWDVKDDEVRSAVERVHRQLSLGHPLAPALAVTQRSLIQARAPLSAWSAYVVEGGVGATRQP